MFRLFGMVLALFAAPLWSAVHVTNVTSNASGKISQQDLYTSDGKLLMVERSFNSSAAAPGAGGAVTTAQELGAVQDRTVFNPDGPELVSLESDGSCRVLDANTKAPAGMADMAAGQQQYADAMAQARQQMEQAMAQARKEGMTPEQERAVQAMLGRGGPGGMPGGPPPGADPGSGKAGMRPTGRTESFGQFGTAEAYEETNATGAVTNIYWLVPVSQIPGGDEVREAMTGLIDFYQEFMQSMGVGQLMDSSSLTAIRDLPGMYPVARDDVAAGERDQVIAVSRDDGGANYTPDCTRRVGMFEN